MPLQIPTDAGPAIIRADGATSLPGALAVAGAQTVGGALAVTGAISAPSIAIGGGAVVPCHPGYIAGRFYATTDGTLLLSGAVAAIDQIYFYPYIPPAPITFSGARARTQTAGAGSSMKSGIWANSPVSMKPLGAPLFVDNTGVTTQASTTDVTAAIGAGTLSAGVLYWIGTKFTGTLPVMYNISSLSALTQYIAGTAGTMNATHLQLADTYSNNMPTIAEGASFTPTQQVIPHLWLAT